MQKLSGNQAAKAASKPKSGRKKVHQEDNDNDDIDEPASEEDKIAESVKLKKGMKPRGQGKKVPAKRKTTESDDDDSTDNNDREDDEDKKVTNSKQTKAKKTNKKKVQTGKNGKNAKKKAK